jgi:predicted RNA-binding protein with TRAM domain
MMNRMQRDTYAGTKPRADSGSQRRTHVTSLTKGEEFDVTISEMGHNGDGICKIDNYTVFVRNTVLNEKVRIRLVKVKDTIAWADRL